MAYCTTADIESKIDKDELIRLTDDAGAGTPDTTKIQEAITEAGAEIDSYCARLHTVPFPDPVPAMIVKVCKDIAVYNVYSLKNAAPEDCEDRYERSVAYLKNVARGIVDLGAGSPEEVDDGGPETIKTASDSIFTLGKMEGF
ncbi:MAG: DUF1320 domain-containing protein [Proteobacteria bacterium]|nr:DUF1320 domain-containing protein [Pseudomonadota bacterium]